MHETPSSDRQPTLRLVAMPTDTNAHGDIFGGWLMSQVDIAGSIVAYRRAGGRVVTVAVNAFQFLRPVYVGDLVSGYAEVVRVGRTSITVAVEVYVDRDRGTARREKVAEATLTYVAIDENRLPRPLPPNETRP